MVIPALVMGGLDIPKNDIDAPVRPRCHTLRSYASRSLRKLDGSAPINMAAPPVVIINYYYFGRRNEVMLSPLSVCRSVREITQRHGQTDGRTDDLL